MVCPSWFAFIFYNPVRKALTERTIILDKSGITKDQHRVAPLTKRPPSGMPETTDPEMRDVYLI